MTKTDAGHYIFDDPVEDRLDREFVHNSQGLSVGGEIVLPSGKFIPPPPAGYWWAVSGSGIVQVRRKY